MSLNTDPQKDGLGAIDLPIKLQVYNLKCAEVKMLLNTDPQKDSLCAFYLPSKISMGRGLNPKFLVAGTKVVSQDVIQLDSNYRN